MNEQAIAELEKVYGRRVPHARTGNVVGFLAPDKFTPIEEAQNTTSVTLPGRIVRGLIAGAAMAGTSDSKIAFEVLNRAAFEPAKPRGEKATLTAPTETLRQIADFLLSLNAPGSERSGIQDRFGFSRSEAGKMADRILEQLNI